MELTHQSITGREFELNRRGYDPDTVDTHLAEIAAEVANRENRIAELESTVASLQVKVQDADESEEALRLTLKAAAHAKEELLAGARDQVKVMEGEASANAEQVTTEATSKAAALVAEATEQAEKLTTDAQLQADKVTTDAQLRADKVIGEATAESDRLSGTAQARATAMEEGARQQAREVAQAALGESEMLVSRIEELRGRLAAAEEALSALQADIGPKIDNARSALDNALEKARESVDNPEMLEKLAAEATIIAAPPSAVPSFPAPEPVEASHEAAAPDPAMEQDGGTESALQDQEPVHPTPEPEGQEAPQITAEDMPQQGQPAAVDAETVEHHEQDPDAPLTTEGEPHLEVVESPESAADISDKVDRLLEELREVT